ncbi:hypothetical protein jhhlp_006744, partial [Lomentospora prolificans]
RDTCRLVTSVAKKGHSAASDALVGPELHPSDHPSKAGRTPLSPAAQNGHITVVKRLMELATVSADLVDASGKNPISWAAENGHRDVVALLRGDS